MARRRGYAAVPRATRPAAAPLAAALLLVAAAPAGEAQPAAQATFSSLVLPGDFDAAPSALMALGASLCFHDASGNGAPDASEAVYLRREPCPGPPSAPRTLRDGDVRLSGPATGTRVGDSPEANRTLLPYPSPWNVRYADRNHDDQWSAGDALYLLATPDRQVAQPGDLRLTAMGSLAPGTFVGAGDADAQQPVSAVVQRGVFVRGPDAWKAWDADGDARFSAADVVVLDLDGSGDVTVQDLRITGFRSLPPGSVAAPGDPDVRPRLLRFGASPWLCFHDAGGNGLPGAGDAFYASPSGCPAPGALAARLAPGDARLSGPGAGSVVEPDDADLGLPVHAVAGQNLGYVDLDRSGRWSAHDALYLHMSAGRSTVEVGDLRLTRLGSFPAGSLVAVGDSDLKFTTLQAMGTVQLSARDNNLWGFWDAQGDWRFGSGDGLYLDLDADGSPGPLDLRLTVIAGQPFGAVLRPGDPDVRPRLLPAFPRAALCFGDADRNLTLGPGEGVYLQPSGCGPARAGSARLSGGAAGSKLREGDPDAHLDLAPLPVGSLAAFYDADSSDAWSLGDTLYVHLRPNASAVGPGDLRLTPYTPHPAGGFVRTGDADVGLATVPIEGAGPWAARWRAWDLDNDRALGGEDVLYIDMDASGAVSVLDVRASELRPEAFGIGLLAAEIPELHRTIAALERGLEEQAEQVAGLRAQLEERNRTLASLEANLTQARADNQRLRDAQAKPMAREPGFEAALAAGALVAVAVLVRRRT